MTDQANRSPGSDRLTQIYLSGLQGGGAPFPISFEELERRAAQALSEEAFGYVHGGAGAGTTMLGNRLALDAWRIIPRMLRDVSLCRLDVRVVDQHLESPILLAPIGVQGIIHQEGEIASTRAAASLAMPFILSSVSSRTIEDVAEAAGPMPRWFQLYWSTRRDIVISFIERAEKTGYSAIVVTVDASLMGWRERDLSKAYLPFLHGEGLANFFSDPAFLRTLEASPTENPRAAIQQFAQIFSNPALSWSDIKWLREQTDLPIFIKGILHPEDARLAVDHGANGVIVSNHGGRQVDGAVPAVTALVDVAEAVGDDCAVLFDSGIRRGSDIVKAIALGARAVLVGRPYVYGLAVDGEQGVRDFLLNLLAELDLTMRLAGYSAIEDLGPHCLAK